MLIIMALYCSVSRFVFVNAVRRYQNGRHHGKVSVGGGYHVRHYVAVIVLAGPYKAALGADNAGNRIINQGIEILNAQLLKSALIFRVKDFLKNILEGMVVFFGNGVFGGKPQSCFVSMA